MTGNRTSDRWADHVAENGKARSNADKPALSFLRGVQVGERVQGMKDSAAGKSQSSTQCDKRKNVRDKNVQGIGDPGTAQGKHKVFLDAATVISFPPPW